MRAGAGGGRLRGAEAAEFFGGLGCMGQESWSRTPAGLHGAGRGAKAFLCW